LNNPIPGDQVDKEMATFGQDLSEVAVKMLPFKKISFYFNTSSPEESLHIIVVPTKRTAPA
jgi:hypothetical protein